MKHGSRWKSAVVAGAVAFLLVSCTGAGQDAMGVGDHSNIDHSNMEHSRMDRSDAPAQTDLQAGITGKVTLTGNTFTLTAQVSRQEIAPGKSFPVWTFNNSVPGPEIRVKQGELVKITLKNELPEPTTIHWHGLPVPNAMDGVPGVTQNAVQPGQSFTYEFKADVPGTYWYHSHQDSANQIDRGLYGAFIVEPRDGNNVDRDYTLVLDEWIGSDMGMPEGNMDMSGMEQGHMSTEHDMDHGQMNMGHDMSMYDLYTINGKSGPLVEKLPVKEGDKVRIRLINAGYLSHHIHLHGHDFQITAIDGQPIHHPGILKDKVVAIAPGERYDIEFVANNPGQWLIEDHGNNEAVKSMKAVIVYEGAAAGDDRPNETTPLRPSI